MQITFSKIYYSMPSYLLQESIKNGWKCGLHTSHKSGVTVVDFVPTYNNDNSPITFDDSVIPSKEVIESGIVDFEKIYNAQISRQAEYPSLDDVTIALAEKAEGRSEMWDEITAKRDAVRTKFPKP